MRWLLAGLVLAALGAGCIGDQGDEDIVPTNVTARENVTAVETTTWSQDATTMLGWVAAVGAQGPVDSTVGVTNYQEGECPRAAFVVPAGATGLWLNVSSSAVNASRGGVGTYEVVLEGPDSVWFRQPAVTGALSLNESSPAPGPWTVHLRPTGATVRQAWHIGVAIEGDGSSPDLPLELVLAGRCPHLPSPG